MAINPFPRIQPLDIPTYLPSAARAPEGTFSNIASIGDAIGQYRERNKLAEVAKGAIGPDGHLDINKFATGAALAGIDPMRALTIAEAARGRTTSENAQRALEAYHDRTAAEAERANLEAERQRQQGLDQPQQTIVPPSLMSPGGAYSVPRDPAQPPVYRPFPQQSTPGPQSSLEPPAPNMAAAEPDPESAPPYQVAGPPMPSPQAGATVAPPAVAAAPAATLDRDEAFLQRLPPNAQTIVKGVANYEIDPASFTGKDREEVIAAAKKYRPDYNMTEYQKRGSPPSGEIAARIGLSKAFLEKVPDIRERLQNNELNSWAGAATAIWGQGGPGELRRAIDEGSEALLRGLTGAGMGIQEATNYARRYQFDLRDNKDTAIRKLNELENALRYVTTEVGKGRGGEDVLKGFNSQFGKEVVPGGTGSPLKFDEKTLSQYKQRPELALDRAKRLLDAKVDPGRVRDLLRQVDPSLPARLGL